MRPLNSHKISQVLLLGLVFLLPLAFFRGLLDSFDLTKATILWLLSPVLLFGIIARWRGLRDDKALLLLTVALLCVLAASTVTSIRPASSFFGQYQRYCGVLTWISGLLVLVSSALFSNRDFVEKLRIIVSVAVAICSGYVLLQAADLDPWTWVYGGQNKPLFGTMGNINTSAGFLGISICFLLPNLLRKQTAGQRIIFGLPVLMAGSAIGLNESFQGNVALLIGAVSSLVVIIFDRNISFIPSVSFVFLVVGSAFVTRTSLIGLLTLGSGIAILMIWTSIDARWSERSSKVRSFSIGTRATFVVSSFLASGLVLSSLILDELRDGMRERAAFYRSALGLWADRPILGYGLETFGFLFSRNRPEWHAINFEGNRPSSAHSVFLGLLVSGGILLFAIFVFVIVIATYRSARKLMNEQKIDVVRVALLTMLLGAVVQSAVSVENVTLLTFLFLAIGMNLADLDLKSRPSIPWKVAKSAFWAIPLVLLCLVLWFHSLRPMRADYSAREALAAANVDNDFEKAVKKFESSIEIAWWDPQQKVRYLAFLQDNGALRGATDLAYEAAIQYNCLPSVALGSMYALAESGDFTRAIELGECALKADPNSALVRSQVISVYSAMASAASDMQREGVAQAMAELILELDPTNALALSISAHSA